MVPNYQQLDVEFDRLLSSGAHSPAQVDFVGEPAFVTPTAEVEFLSDIFSGPDVYYIEFDRMLASGVQAPYVITVTINIIGESSGLDIYDDVYDDVYGGTPVGSDVYYDVYDDVYGGTPGDTDTYNDIYDDVYGGAPARVGTYSDIYGDFYTTAGGTTPGTYTATYLITY